MSIWSKLLTGGASSLIDSLGGAIDNLTTSKEEKLEAKAKMRKILNARAAEADRNYRAELEARQEVIKAEMAQGDSYTKRARPSIVYAGLLFIFLVHVALPMFAFFAQREVPELTLPEPFWWSWGSVVSVWSAGRSAEKRGAKSKLVKGVTGG